uniref:Trehalase n=1 Tax=Ditylenchus dipsaci TaxID=166011 RepID=A0A915E3U6_9BILA
MHYYNSRLVWLVFVLLPICSSYLNVNILRHKRQQQPDDGSSNLLSTQPTDQGDQDMPIQMCDAENSNNSFIYCSGRILAAAMAHYFPHADNNDSKTFVDKPLKYDAKEVLDKFNQQFPPQDNDTESIANIDPKLLVQFIEQNFEPENHELESCVLNEWTENPPLLELIKDDALREWAMDLNALWKILVEVHPDRYSLLYVPKCFVVPGGRFREFYYWDTYWTIKGLLVSGLHEICKNMIENFVHMVNKTVSASLLTAIVYEYYEATRDIEFIRSVLPALERELEFWDTKRGVKVEKGGQIYDLYHYRTESNVPRPESYREDTSLVEQLTKTTDKRQVWRNLASTAESGWDFSSRWLKDSSKLSSIQTTSIVPVDLNAFMCSNFNILSYLFDEIGDTIKSLQYQKRYNSFLIDFQKVFYVKNASGWYDFNLKTKEHKLDYYASIAIPLFTKCYHSIDLAQSENIFNRMEELGVFNFAGGIPTSLNNDSGQQ